MNVQTVRSTDQPDQRNARRDAPHPRAVESTEAGSAMADDRREDILKDLPEEVKLLLQFEVLKELKRQNPLAMAERKERVGEHSWHLALSVLLLAEFASEPIDIARAALLAIVHDTVEAFVGDTFAFGPDVSGAPGHERAEGVLRLQGDPPAGRPVAGVRGPGDVRGPFRQRNGRVPSDRLELHERGTLVVEPARRALGSSPEAARLCA